MIPTKVRRRFLRASKHKKNVLSLPDIELGRLFLRLNGTDLALRLRCSYLDRCYDGAFHRSISSCAAVAEPT